MISPEKIATGMEQVQMEMRHPSRNLPATLWLRCSFSREIQRSIRGRTAELWGYISGGRWRTATVPWQTGWHSPQLWSALTYSLCSGKAQHCLCQQQDGSGNNMILPKNLICLTEGRGVLTCMVGSPSLLQSCLERDPLGCTRSSSWRWQQWASWMDWQDRHQPVRRSAN